MFTAAGSVTALTLALALALALPLSTAQASSDYIVYQGVAFNDGTAVASTDIALRFSILASNDAVIYQETQASVMTTDKGFFSHQIGSGTPVVVGGSAATYAAIAWADDYKLQVGVDYANGTTYTILGTQALSSSVYALRAKTAAKLATPININGVAFDGSADITAPTNLGITGTTGTQTITSDTGTDAIIPVATESVSGLVSTAAQTFAGVKTFSSQPVIPITTNVPVQNTDRLLISDANDGRKIRGGAAFGTTTTTYLTNAGTWATPVGVPQTLSLTRSWNQIAVLISGGGNVNLETATTTTAGLMSTTDRVKLDGIAVGAQTNVATNLGFTAGSIAGPTITSSTGGSVVIPSAGWNSSGVVTSAEQTFGGNKSFEGDVYLSATTNKLGVGTKHPGYPIHVTSVGSRAAAQHAHFILEGGGAAGMGSNAFSRNDIAIWAEDFIAGKAFLAYSDTRIKEDITPIKSAISTLQSLEPVSYTKIDKVANGNGLHYGFIAQDLEAVIPEAVTKSFGEVPVLKLFDDVVFEEGASYTILVKNGEEESQQEYTTGQERPVGEVFVINKKVDDFRTVDHNMILAQAVAAIKEQQVLIEALQNELKEIKEELRATNQSNR